MSVVLRVLALAAAFVAGSAASALSRLFGHSDRLFGRSDRLVGGADRRIASDSGALDVRPSAVAVVTPHVDSRVIRRFQVALIAIGLALMALGVVVLFVLVEPGRYLGIALWFAAAIIVHDAILSPVVFAVAVLMRKAGRAIPLTVILIVQGALVVGGIFAILVVPEIYKKSIGRRNPTVLPLEYGSNLLWFYVALIVATALAIVVYLGVVRRQKTRPSLVQV